MPLVISSDKLLRHRPTSYHPECPERIEVCLKVLQQMENEGSIRLMKPSGELNQDRLQLALGDEEPSFLPPFLNPQFSLNFLSSSLIPH